MNELKIPCNNQPKFSPEDFEIIRDSVDIREVLKASEEIRENLVEKIDEMKQETLSEVQSCTSECFLEVERNLAGTSLDRNSFHTPKQSFHSPLHYSSPHDSMALNFCEGSRATFNEESYQQLEANFVESVVRKAENAHSETSLVSSPSSGLITKLRQMLRGSKASSFIDDVSSPEIALSRASDANLSLIPEIPFTEATQSCDNSHKTLLLETHKNHEASKTSNTSLRRASTFLTERDIFDKTMAARRHKLTSLDSDTDGKLKSSTWSDSESNLNECIKHVYNFSE